MTIDKHRGKGEIWYIRTSSIAASDTENILEDKCKGNIVKVYPKNTTTKEENGVKVRGESNKLHIR